MRSSHSPELQRLVLQPLHHAAEEDHEGVWYLRLEGNAEILQCFLQEEAGSNVQSGRPTVLSVMKDPRHQQIPAKQKQKCSVAAFY